MRVVVFEDELSSNFGPLTLLRHTSQLRWGTKTLLESLSENTTDATDVILWGRRELKGVTMEQTRKGYNEEVDGQAVFVNARARPDGSLRSLTARRSPFIALADGQLLAAKLNASSISPGPITKNDVKKAVKGVERLEAPSGSLFAGFWELVESNGLAIAEQAKHTDDPLALPGSVEVRGPHSNLLIAGGAEVEFHVTFDTRLGPIVIEDGASIESFSRIMGPCYLGPKTKVYSALIGGGTSVFEGCKLGGQVENSIIMPHTNKAHHGYIGDSYVGEWVNLGAGSTFSNLKNTYANVRLELTGKRVDSGLLKLGPAVGDMSKVSIGALVYAGRMLGTGCHIAGLAGTNVPSFTYLGGSGKMVELLLDSVVETQRRMMERRGRTLTRAEEALIRWAFRFTSTERRKGGVKKGRLS